MSDVEIRPFAEPVEIRSADGKLTLSGVAIRYGARSRDLGGFRERIMPGAATEAIQKGDILALDEHRHDRYLGRMSNATLRLFDTAAELRYEVDLPDTQVGREVAALAERKDYKGSSFGFRANVKTVKWSKDDDGTALRSVHGFTLVRDVGPTITPAYDTQAAEVALRHFPAETGREIEVRSVLEAAQRGDLARLLDEEEIPPNDDTPPVFRRPTSWFV